MFYRRRSGSGAGVSRWIVKTEHILGFAIFLIFVSSVLLFFGAMIQAGYSDTVNVMIVQFMTFLGYTPWYVWLIVDVVALAFLYLASGKGE